MSTEVQTADRALRRRSAPVSPRILGTMIVFLLAMWTPAQMAGGAQSVEALRYLAFAMLAGGLGIDGLLRRSNRWHLTARSLPVLMFLALATVSPLWGPPSLFGYSKAALLCIAGCFAVSTARQLSLISTVRCFVTAVTLFVAAGVAVAVFLPAIGVESAWGLEGMWRGLAGQKNEFGALASISLLGLVLLPRALDGGWPRLLAIAVVAVALLMSGSRGAQLSVLAGFGVGAWLVARRRVRLPIGGAALAVGVSLGIVALIGTQFDASSGLLTILGVELDSSNRLAIWNYGLIQLQGKELLGTGLGGFWTDDRAADFHRMYGWVIENFHNGYISAYIEIGFIGLLFSVVALYLTLITAIQRAVSSGARSEIFAASLVTMFAVANLVENWLVRSTNFYLLLFLCLSFILLGTRRRRRPTR